MTVVWLGTPAVGSIPNYGTDGAQFEILEGFNRGARFGSNAAAAAYWQAVLDFLE